MKQFFASCGGEIIKKYVEAILTVPERAVAEQYCDVIVQLCDQFRDQNDLPTMWLTLAMDEVPITVFTRENKVKLIGIVSPSNQSYKKHALLYELDLLCKRARSSAIRH